MYLKPGTHRVKIAGVKTQRGKPLQVQYQLVGHVYKHGRPTVHDWPVFYPLDPNVSCWTCKQPWATHGTTHGHCPPCMKEIPPTTKASKGLGLKSNCHKVSGHKGKCRP